MSDGRVRILRLAAARLRERSTYQWGHMGMCNCGHLARAIREVSAHDIHRAAMERGGGDWNERVRDHCPDSGFLIDEIISDMLAAGFSHRDIGRLERLSDPEVRARLGKSLARNQRENAIAYLEAWADLLEASIGRDAA